MTVESSWNVMADGDAWEGKWRGNWQMEWVASTLHTTSEHGVSSITTAEAQTSAASSQLNWRPRRFKWTRPFRRKTKSGFFTCAITFQALSRTIYHTACTELNVLKSVLSNLSSRKHLLISHDSCAVHNRNKVMVVAEWWILWDLIQMYTIEQMYF
jgi:hypothetical protein